jgi:hypothetical protein
LAPEIWIAIQDEDQQNANLALRIWEDNGLDVPAEFLHVLLEYLGPSFCDWFCLNLLIK